MQLEFLIIRYVPDVVKNEFVNFGILLREYRQPATSVVSVTNDWSRVLGLDPDADIEMLTSLGFELVTRSRSVQETAESIDHLLDQLSETIQITDLKASEANSFESTLALLMEMYVERRIEPVTTREETVTHQSWRVYPNLASSTRD